MHGGFLTPGLVDAHVHMGATPNPPWRRVFPDEMETLRAFLYAGVTTVLDTGGVSWRVLPLRDRANRGALLLPRVFAAGPIFTAPGGHPAAMMDVVAPWPFNVLLKAGMTRQVDNPQDAIREVVELAPQRPDFIKVAVDRIPPDAPRMSAPVLKALVTAAHAQRLRVVAHIGSNQDVLDAMAAGVDALVHGVYLEPISAEALAALARAHAPVVATASVFDVQERFAPGGGQPLSALEREIADPEALAATARRPADFDGSAFEPWVRACAQARQARRDNIARMRAHGITVLAGSDSPNVNHVAGAGLHLELDVLRESGMTAGEALRAATSDNAAFLAGEGAEFGRVAEGLRADLLWFAEDPLEVPERIHTPGMVVAAGRVLQRQARPAR